MFSSYNTNTKDDMSLKTHTHLTRRTVGNIVGCIVGTSALKFKHR